jgi:cysteinyl-tRNA synthetase
MKIFNTLSRQLEDFVPITPGRVGLYTCGPTVYNYAHIGNFRAYIFEDLLRRYLKFSGLAVHQVMNLTDVDDKTIKGSMAQKVSLNDFTRTYKEAFFSDLKIINIEPAECYPAATDHIPEMIAIIRTLLDKGVAYPSDDGSIYYSIAMFPGYGRLAHLDMAGLRSGARVAQDEYEKENAADFALWKAWDANDGDVAWDSPWGRGRPGWHLECSAMSMKYLGETFDLHTGGVDNIFPHHEDEIAQSEAATGKPFVHYWMHCAHLVVDGRKMSKSLGNFHTLRDVVARGYSGREIRYVLISAHYRQSLNFSFAALDAARATLGRFDEFLTRLKERAAGEPDTGALPDWAARARTAFVAGLDNDLNISEAMAALFNMIHEGNRALDAGRVEGCLRPVINMMMDLDRVLGFLHTADESVPPGILQWVEARAQARKEKNWAESDRIRSLLTEAGWDVKDSAEGPKLRRLK